jgi:hypothetical protein
MLGVFRENLSLSLSSSSSRTWLTISGSVMESVDVGDAVWIVHVVAVKVVVVVMSVVDGVRVRVRIARKAVMIEKMQTMMMEKRNGRNSGIRDRVRISHAGLRRRGIVRL